MRLRVPPREYRDLVDAARRLDHSTVLAHGEAVLTQVSSDPDDGALVTTTLLLVGRSLARIERWPQACAWLEHGLTRLPQGGRLVPPALRRSGSELGRADAEQLLLVDLYLRLGRWDDAIALVHLLEQPERRVETRLGATRARIALAATFGDFGTANQLLNTASDLARRNKGRVVEAVVEGDRALVLGAQGRLGEAVTFADAVLPMLAAAGSSPQQQWANGQAVAVLTGLARALAEAGDPLTTQRYLWLAEAPVGQVGGSFAQGLLDLATSTALRHEGLLDAAEERAQGALQRFSLLAAAPAVTLTRLEQAKAAEARGWALSARSLWQRALADTTILRLPRETAEARAALARLPA